MSPSRLFLLDRVYLIIVSILLSLWLLLHAIEFNDYNGAIFNIRARSLNNLVYWLAQIIGSLSIGFLLDQRSLSRRLRAFSGWLVLLFMVFVVHIWTYFYQRNYTRETVESGLTRKIDIYDREYVGRVMLYICCGLLDAMWQTCAYWVMGAMSNDPAKLAHFSGFCESPPLLFPLPNFSRFLVFSLFFLGGGTWGFFPSRTPLKWRCFHWPRCFGACRFAFCLAFWVFELDCVGEVFSHSNRPMGFETSLDQFFFGPESFFVHIGQNPVLSTLQPLYPFTIQLLLLAPYHLLNLLISSLSLRLA